MVTSASPSTADTSTSPECVRTAAHPARPVTVTSPAPVRAASREPAGAVTVTTSGTSRSGISLDERTTSRRPGSDQTISAARTASAARSSGSAPGPPVAWPIQLITPLRPWAHMPPTAGSWRTSTRTSGSSDRSRCTSMRPTSTESSSSATPWTGRLSRLLRSPRGSSCFMKSIESLIVLPR